MKSNQEKVVLFYNDGEEYYINIFNDISLAKKELKNVFIKYYSDIGYSEDELIKFIDRCVESNQYCDEIIYEMNDRLYSLKKHKRNLYILEFREIECISDPETKNNHKRFHFKDSVQLFLLFVYFAIVSYKYFV